MKVSFLRWMLLVMTAVMAIGFSGCATTEPENASSRPWGYRSGYDPGMPGILNEGR